MTVPISQLSDESYDALIAHIDLIHPEINASKTLRDLWAFGFGEPDSVRVSFYPHRTESGSDYYLYFGCRFLNEAEWKCDNPKEKRELTVEDPIDHIDLSDDISAQTATRIVESIRHAIVINDVGHYRYTSWDEERISDTPLNITSIYRTEDGLYGASIDYWEDCSAHRVVLDIIPCGLDNCSFEVLSNTISFHP